MRAMLIVIGIILLVAGIWVTVGHGSYQQTDTKAQIGSVKIQSTEDHAIPQWAGIAGIVVVGVLAIAGFASKR